MCGFSLHFTLTLGCRRAFFFLFMVFFSTSWRNFREREGALLTGRKH